MRDSFSSKTVADAPATALGAKEVIYLHGFASGPNSRKARLFREKFTVAGQSIRVPDLAQGDFAGLTLTDVREVCREFAREAFQTAGA